MNFTLQKRRMHGVRTEKAELYGLDMSSTEGPRSIWYGCKFTFVDFSTSNFAEAEFVDCTFRLCDLRMVNFLNAKLRHVRFEECDLRKSAFVAATPMEKVEFHDSKLQYASFFNSTVRDVVFKDSNLHGSDLRYLESYRVKYDGSNLWSAQVAFGCQFLGNGAMFDERACDLFVAMVAKVMPNEKKAAALREVCGDMNKKVVDRLMDERKVG